MEKFSLNVNKHRVKIYLLLCIRQLSLNWSAYSPRSWKVLLKRESWAENMDVLCSDSKCAGRIRAEELDE